MPLARRTLPSRVSEAWTLHSAASGTFGPITAASQAAVMISIA